MFDGPEGATAHLIWYCRAADTVLSETEDETEIFQWPDCQDGPLLSILRRCQVLPAEGVEDDGITFWCQLQYEPSQARFETL